MGLPGDLGQVREGFLADLLLVDGNPLVDPAVLLDRTRLRAVMKGGQFHKEYRRDDASTVSS
jgi:imidazolonepropionase-like amidohydrolase